MNYRETTEYLFNQLPMYERQGTSGYKSGLDNTIALDNHLGHPHKAYKTIHIAGTNGKGSCAHTIAAMLQLCGYKVGLYTSPHLVDFRERIKVNGVTASEKYVVDFVAKEADFFEPLHPTFFELTTAMALNYFRQEGVDIAVIETGLGGRLDCTNIITPLVSVITNIGHDHTQLLGNTLEEIATEKAGIIKPGVTAIIGEATKQTHRVFEVKAKETGSNIIFAEDQPEIIKTETADNGSPIYTAKGLGEIKGELRGAWQAKNANTILTTVRELERQGYLYMDNATEIRDAFTKVTQLTGLRGRWETVREKPMTVCDTGHNKEAWREIAAELERTQCKTLHIVAGFMADKDIDGIMELMPKRATYYLAEAKTKRAATSSTLMAKARAHGLNATGYNSVKEAFTAADKYASDDDFLFIGGSTYVVADFMKDCL